MMNKILHIFISTLVFCSCESNTVPCEWDIYEGALIPVMVDWSGSQLWLDDGSLDVHRLSLRFFASDGSLFERYLEGELSQGSIYVPVGVYQVLAINESIADSYYSGFVTFTDIKDFNAISAELLSDASSGVATEPKRLAVWSLSHFEVTPNMTSTLELTDYETEQMDALTNVVMEPRTRRLRVELQSENLGSVLSISGNVSGLPMRVNLVTGESEGESVVHAVSLTDFNYDQTKTRAEADADGVASGEQACFTHDDDSTDGYSVDFKVYLNDGSEHVDDDELSGVDVSSQVTDSTDELGYTLTHSYTFPVVEQNVVNVDDWIDGGSIVLGGE